MPIPYAGRVFTEEEVVAAVSSTLDFWLTLGTQGSKMENELSEFLGVKKCLLVNSGSSANLVAISALTSYKLGEKKINKGDEVITVAAGFPTTVAPILQIGAKPVFIDADVITGNANCDQLEKAYKKGKTKAVMMAHALGNPFNLSKILEFCENIIFGLLKIIVMRLGAVTLCPKIWLIDLGLPKIVLDLMMVKIESLDGQAHGAILVLKVFIHLII